ncbi:F-box only protein 7-like [Helicoverpa armigera]|uniref:F-box only protein 7-like n=1 Tax=Helicoverpa armigera TaxID=29058 RepID=UPI003083C1E0
MEWFCSRTWNKAIPPQFHKTLNALIETLIKPETLKRDFFFALLLIVVKENDFVQTGNTEIDVLDYILEKRKDGREVYEVTVILRPYLDTPANIIVCPLNDTLLINAYIDANKETYSLCLPINELFLTSALGIPSDFSNMSDLITTLREKIVLPVKSSILNYHCQPCGSLNGLPNDVLFHILIRLSLTDILSIAESCKKLNEVVKDENLWSRLFRRDFPRMRNNKEVDWRCIYKKAYKKNKKNAQKAHRGNVIEEIAEWPDFLPVRDSRWEVIL